MLIFSFNKKRSLFNNLFLTISFSSKNILARSFSSTNILDDLNTNILDDLNINLNSLIPAKSVTNRVVTIYINPYNASNDHILNLDDLKSNFVDIISVDTSCSSLTLNLLILKSNKNRVMLTESEISSIKEDIAYFKKVLARFNYSANDEVALRSNRFKKRKASDIKVNPISFKYRLKDLYRIIINLTSVLNKSSQAFIDPSMYGSIYTTFFNHILPKNCTSYKIISVTSTFVKHVKLGAYDEPNTMMINCYNYHDESKAKFNNSSPEASDDNFSIVGNAKNKGKAKVWFKGSSSVTKRIGNNELLPFDQKFIKDYF